MSKKIQILLLEDVTNIGRAGDIADVNEGYARNFLFPQGKAALATNNVKRQADEKKAKQEEDTRKELSVLQQQAESLDGKEIFFTERAKENKEIFGRITAAMVAKEISQQSGFKIKTKDVILEKPLTSFGTFDVTVSLSADVEAVVKVTIEVDPASLKKSDEQD